MKYPVSIIILLVFSCTNHKAEKNYKAQVVEFYPANTSPPETKTMTLDLLFIDWLCECANWIENDKYEEFEKQGTLSENSIFIEPADSSLALPDTLAYSADVIKFTGNFYSEKGYPKNYPISEQVVKPARVFRYTDYKIVRSNYRNFIEK